MNKKTKKRIVGLALVFALFAVIASGTLAYFTDETKEATNTFTVGKVQIRLSEAIVNEDGLSTDKEATADIWDETGKKLRGTRTDEGNKDQVTGYDGKDYGYALVPNKTVDKDPIITVLKGSEECYVRAQVTLDHASKFLQVFNKHKSEIGYTGGTSTSDIQTAIDAMTSFFVGYDKTVWKAVNAEVDSKADTITVTFNYVKTDTVKKNANANTDLDPIITAVTLPWWVTSEDALLFEGTDVVGFNVDVIGQAIQAAGFADADAAWANFENPKAPAGN